MTALFIGRFQPFHNGHASVLEQMQRDGIDHVIIGVGSAQYSRTSDNPFTFDERRDMITAALADGAVPSYEIIAIEDIHNPPQWVEHVNSLVPSYDVAYSGNEIVRQLLTEAGTQVRAVPDEVDIDASRIRDMVVADNPQWRDFVHPDVATLIDQHDFTDEA